MSKLAIEGGMPAIEGFEGRGQPKISHEEFLSLAETWGYSPKTIEQIRALIEKEDLGSGPMLARYHRPDSKVARMEREIEERFGVKHVLAVTSGTAALHTAYVAADIGCGDEVLVPGYTFAATAMAVIVARGVPVWCEIDESMTLDPVAAESRITSRTKAIVPVHMNGFVCNMDALLEVARRHRLLVIEDCAQAYGASFKGRRVGTIGSLGCFSISSYKVTGAGEAGLVMTDDDVLYTRAQGWAEAGGLWRPDRFAKARWEGELFSGLNYRMSELEGAVNLIQTRKSDAQLARWRTNKRRIVEALPAYHEIPPQKIHDPDGEMGHTLGFFASSPKEAVRVAKALRAEGLSAHTRGEHPGEDWHYYQHIHQILEKASATSDGCPWRCPNAPNAAALEYSPDMCPKTLDLTSRHVAVGVNQWWTESDCKQVVAALTKVFDAFYTRNHQFEHWLAAATS